MTTQNDGTICVTQRPENADLYYNMISKVLNRFMGWWLFALQFREARWRFDRQLKGDDEQRVGGGGGKRWEMENWQRKCCTNNNQWRSVWGRVADSAFLNNERNEKLKMSNLIILSSAPSVMHGGRTACLHFISLQRRKKMKPDKVSRSPIEYRKDDSTRCSTWWQAASSLEDCGLTSRSEGGCVFFCRYFRGGDKKMTDDLGTISGTKVTIYKDKKKKIHMKTRTPCSLIEQGQNHFSPLMWVLVILWG